MIPEEFMMHRYLTVGESHRFLDERKKKEKDTLSLVTQDVESAVSAVYECKRLFYLILHNKKRFFPLASKAFEYREKRLINKVNTILKSAKTLLKKNKKNVCKNILKQF